MLAPYSNHMLHWGRLRFLLPSRRTCLSLPVPEERARMPSCSADSHGCRRRSFETASSCQPDANSGHVTPPNLLLFPESASPPHCTHTDQKAIYFQQRAYDLSLMFLVHGNGKAEDHQKGLSFMGSPLINRGAAQMQGQGFSVVMLVPYPNLHGVCVSMSQGGMTRNREQGVPSVPASALETTL